MKQVFEESMKEGTRVLVTGGTGFVGGHLVAHLIENRLAVRCLVRPQSRYRALATQGAELVFGALDDPASLKRAVKDCEVVFHLAGATKALDERSFAAVNTEGTRALGEAAATTPVLRRFVFVSSLAACGPSPDGEPLDETGESAPVSLYGRSKLDAEALLQESALPVVIVRPPAVYGPGDRDMFSLFQLASRGVFPRIGEDERRISLVHVHDLACGLLRAAAAQPGGVYFLADPRIYTDRDIKRILERVFDRRLVPLPVSFPLFRYIAVLSEWGAKLTRKPGIISSDKVRELAHPCWICSSEKARIELGFQCRYSLEEGFRNTVAWYREQGML